MKKPGLKLLYVAIVQKVHLKFFNAEIAESFFF